ncbi:histidine--tRNA ligase [Clostridium tepidiprofundi DSM 19306]|uniref:Histidine--tRNA ligase n=1 Tax=Clostridium tepidiprofundi DSM 19306 TaxID=1121338 RepID=A0A151B7W5_9CLOT|nr:histidine--tRNA ligase [Clostridium tepidiprofundi]KYH36015.1 histidine--tRNA ligase [Clostridium tepidiprofundi DSM 19306]
MAIKAPKGTKDLLPQNSYKWQYLEEKLRKIASTYGCREIRTPMFESTELFKRGVGETTDVVQKEMYTFEDKAGRSITLKPEGTAPAARAFIENSMYNDVQPTKLYYFTPCFRYENVQKGRLRQHHQFGVEIFGSYDASADVEVISIIKRVYDELGIGGVSLRINNIGCPDCRPKYNEALKQYLSSRYDELCPICKTRFEKNPLRILDCKNKNCKEIVKEAPTILDYVCDDCANHFDMLEKYLNAVEIEFTVDTLIVRGLDYYTRTVFEFIDGNGSTLCGGGRYNNLIKEIGGPDVPAVGFGMGIERLLIALDEQNIEIPKENYIDLFIGSMGEKGRLFALGLANKLRYRGIKCECDHMNKKVKGQMKYANKIEAKYSVIIGENEIENNSAIFKKMDNGEQIDISLHDLDRICHIINK